MEASTNTAGEIRLT